MAAAGFSAVGFRKSIGCEMLLSILDFRSGGEFYSVVLVVSILVSLMVEQVGSQVGTLLLVLLASSLEAALVECREMVFTSRVLGGACLLVCGTC